MAAAAARMRMAGCGHQTITLRAAIPSRICCFNPPGTTISLSRLRINDCQAQCSSNHWRNSGSCFTRSNASWNSASSAFAGPGRYKSRISLARWLSMLLLPGWGAARSAAGQQLMKLDDAARDARFHGADGDLQDFRNFLIGAILKVKKRQGPLERLVES